RLHDPTLVDDPLVKETQQLLAEGMAHRPLAELGQLLAHPDMRVRQEAQFALAEKGATAHAILVDTLRTSSHQMARLHAIWGLGQQGRHTRAALESLTPLLNDSDMEVRVQAAKVLGETRYAAAGDQLLTLLRDNNPRVRFFAAFALGRLAKAEALVPILQMLRDNADQ